MAGFVKSVRDFLLPFFVVFFGNVYINFGGDGII